MIILVGKTCSGKSSVAKILESKYHYRRIITYTTRPPRSNEVSGDEYYFTTEEEFKRLANDDFFFEVTHYNVANGQTWYYGTANISLNDDSVIVMNPEGMKKAKKLLNPDEFHIKVFYLNTTEGVQYNRLRSRGDPSIEASRRIEADNQDFADIGGFYDYAINTDMIDSATLQPIIPEGIADWINSIMEWERNRIG